MKKWQEQTEGKFHNPPTKDEIEDYFGRNVFAVNQKVFSTFMWETPLLDRMAFYVVQGQLPNIRNRMFKIGKRYYDNRVHATAFIDSGSGKAGFTEYAGLLTSGAGMNLYVLGRATDTALLGRRFQEQEYNREKQRTETIIKETVGCLNPLHDPPCNIIHYNEADILFDTKKTDWAKDIMSHFQKAMNVYKSFDNLMTNDTSLGRIEFHSDVSLLIVSKLPVNYYKVIADTGFLQRTIMDYKSANWELKKTIDMKTLRMLCDYKDVHVDETVNINDVVEVLKAINKFWNNRPQVKIDEDAKKVFTSDVYHALHDPLESMTPYAQKTLSQFVSRWQEHIINLSFHNCYTRLGRSVTVQDVADAKNFVYPLWKNVIFAIEEGLEQPREEKYKWNLHLVLITDMAETIGKKYDKKGWLPRNVLIKVLASKTEGWGCNPETARQRVTKAEEQGYLERKNIQGSPIVRVTSKPKSM